MNLWDRQRIDDELEPTLWFGRFRDYLRMQKPRSIIELCNQWRDAKGNARYHHASGSWVRASQKWNWQERAEAYDAEQERKVQAEWEDRQEQLRQKEWSVANRLLDRCEQMLAFGPARTISADGQTVIEPTDWKFRDVPYAAKLASELARLAANLATEHVDVTSGGKPLPAIESVVFRYNDDD